MRSREYLSFPVGVEQGGLHRPVVIPGAPEDSLLYQRLVQEPYMPPGAPLSQKDIDKVKRWIAEGAKDN